MRPKSAARLFEAELRRRKISFAIESASGRYVVQCPDGERLVSLENLDRDYARDGDESRISRFLDTVLSPLPEIPPWPQAQSSVFLALEPNDYEERPEFRIAVSERIDRVPVLFDRERNGLIWITTEMLADWQVSLAAVEAAAYANLDTALAKAKIAYDDIDGARLGFLDTSLPFKSALILAPQLRSVVSSVLGWPLYAVVPDRDFLFLWDTAQKELIGRVGGVVMKEFSQAAYPLTTEVLEITDEGISAIGAFAPRD